MAQIYSLKSNWTDFKRILDKEGITELYHFTDRSNVASMKEYGGLFSWYMLERARIEISCPGGNDLSRKLDTNKDLENYVHLCFNRDQPMLHVLERDERIRDPIILEIDTQVIFWEDTQFSDMNAAAKTANIGDTLSDFERIRFDIIANGWKDNNEKGYFQAEVLVRKCVPLELIKNI